MMKKKESVYFYYSSSPVASNLNKAQLRRQDCRNGWRNERARVFQRRTSGGCFS